MHKFIVSVALTAIVTGAQAQAKKPVKPAAKPVAPLLKTGNDSLSYAIGVNMADYFKQQGVEHLNYACLNKAISDVFAGKGQILTTEQALMTLQQKMQEYNDAKINVTKEEGRKFLTENKKRPGVMELPDGLQYEVIKKGTGPMPFDTSIVKVNYAGYLLNGKKFDASADHGGPATFPLNRVIKGWTEGVKLMPVGSTYKFYIPSELGYGDKGAGNGSIPGGATLIFEVDLLEYPTTDGRATDSTQNQPII